MTVQIEKVQPAGVISVLNSAETLPVDFKNGSVGVMSVNKKTDFVSAVLIIPLTVFLLIEVAKT